VKNLEGVVGTLIGVALLVWVSVVWGKGSGALSELLSARKTGKPYQLILTDHTLSNLSENPNCIPPS